jgi:hypothetical protein
MKKCKRLPNFLGKTMDLRYNRRSEKRHAILNHERFRKKGQIKDAK